MKRTRGFTLIEMIVTIAILSIVLAGAYSMLGFTNGSLSAITANSDALNEARHLAELLEREVRQARSPAPGIYALDVSTDGNSVAISTYIGGSASMVKYQVTSINGTDVLERSTYAYGSSPSSWSTILTNVLKSSTNMYFKISDLASDKSDKSLIVSMMVGDSQKKIRSPIEINDTYTIRSKGAMP